MKTKIQTFYTDGSYDKTTGIGGFAVIPVSQAGEIVRSRIVAEGCKEKSSMGVELKAVIEAIRRAPTSCPVTIYSDCAVISDVAARKGIKNKGLIAKLWDTFLALLKARTNITVLWVRGHSGNPHNVCANQEARRAFREFSQSLSAVAAA